MNKQGIIHEPKSQMAYAYDRKTLHIRLKTARNDFIQVALVSFDPYCWVPGKEGEDWVFDTHSFFDKGMTLEHSDELFDYWFIEVSEITTLRIRYGFKMYQHGSCSHEISSNYTFYGAKGLMNGMDHLKVAVNGRQYFNFPFINGEDVYQAPKWVKDAVWYQIFPERFADGDVSNNLVGTLPWDSEKEVKNHMNFGGDLQGVIDHLDYIAELGATGIYFTPIFDSPSSHKYDTTDYFKIDPAFGTNETFKQLVEAAHERGMKVMLDAVFNHCGSSHPYWLDVLDNGERSKYFDCFHVLRTPIRQRKNQNLTEKDFLESILDLDFRAFGFVEEMPKWHTENQMAKEYLLEVAKYWVEHYQIDGWRLDVSNEVSHDFWRAFRKTVKSVNPDTYIIGENWDNSYPWLMGDQFDGVMNYELLDVIWKFIGTKTLQGNQTTVDEFVWQLGNYLCSYPKNVIDNMFNMVDSHDTERVMEICEGDVRKAKLIYVLQMILPGSPSIYYGSEVGLTGTAESNRKCMPWEDKIEQQPLFKHLHDLIQLRNQHASMKSQKLEWLAIQSEHNAFVLKKETEEEILIVCMNNGSSPVTFFESEAAYDLTNVMVAPFDFKLQFISKES